MSQPSVGMVPPPKRESKGTPAWAVGLVAVAMLLVGVGGGYLLFHGSAGSSNPSSSGTPGTVSGLPVPSTIATIQGWYNNRSFTYLNFGPNSNETAPILVLQENGMSVTGQRNIIDVIPGKPGYTAFWRVWSVSVPSGYVANTIRSFEQVLNLNLTVTETSTVVNCPVVNPGTTIQSQPGSLVQGWYRNQTVFYWAGETNSTAYGDVVGTAPLYAPQYANGTEVPGQMHIVGVLPGGRGYSDLWQIIKVVVPSSYVANTYRSVSDLYAAQAAGKVTITPTSTLVNCPVV